MASEETAVVKQIMLKASRLGARLLRNNRGQFYTLDGVRALVGAVVSGDLGSCRAAARLLRMVRAGLEAEGASDLIGPVPVIITPEMVGLTLAVFTAAEVKKPGWTKPTDDRERQQEQFILTVRRMGGIGFFITNPDDLEEKISGGIKTLIFDKRTIDNG